MSEPPKISICIPTYNNEITISSCLESLSSQIYPKNLIEILVIDGGSQDNTLNICKEYSVKILNNLYRIEEKGRALGIKEATGDIIAFIDADNIMNDSNLLQKMVMPFIDHDNVVFSEPKFYYARDNDDIITKYISLIGADDPVAVYLGIYDRYCYFKLNWTDSPYKISSKNDTYDIIELCNINDMPPFGANGCFVKKTALLNVKHNPFLHSDVMHSLLVSNNLFAKINTGIIHKQNGSLVNFLRKKARRLNRNYQELERKYYFPVNKKAFVFLLLKALLVFPLFIDAIIGYKNKRNVIWLLHPMMVWLTLVVYMYALLVKEIKK